MRNRKYAVTGGIGSGKSRVLSILSELGYATFSTDEISRELWKTEEYRAALAARFPECCKEGEIDKRLLSALVFSDERARARLNAFAHPRIMKRLLAQAEREKLSFSEVPLLFEGGYETLFDGVLAVRRSEAARLRAIASRDGLSREGAAARIKSQLDAALLSEKKCYIIENDGDEEELRGKIIQFLKTIE